MLKLVAALLLVVVACNGLGIGGIGGFQDRPDLLSDVTVQDLTNFAVGTMFGEQNPSLKNVKITRVQTQVVKGVNYKIDFTGDSVDVSGQKITCQVVIFVGIDSEKTITQTQCQQ